jgi:predicted nucleic acid-binding protein
VIIIRVYWDSNVLISFFLHDQHYKYSKEQIERVYTFKKGKDTILISHLVLLEMIEVLRKRIVEKEKVDELNTSYVGWWSHGIPQKNKNTSEKQKELEHKIAVVIQEAMSLIEQLQNEELLAIVNSTQSLKNYHVGLFAIYKDQFGTIKIEDDCKRCNSKTYPEYKLKGIGYLDILHGLTACEFSSTEIVTFDSYFPRLKRMGLSQFNSVKINVPYFSN